MPRPAEFRIKGLKELDRALGKADKNVRKNLRDKLRTVAEDVATEARQIVDSKGLVDSGDLRAGIRSFSLLGRAGVRSTATHGGFNYPRRLEYESNGRRASLNPAVNAKRGDIERGIEHVLDQMADDFDGGF